MEGSSAGWNRRKRKSRKENVLPRHGLNQGENSLTPPNNLSFNRRENYVGFSLQVGCPNESSRLTVGETHNLLSLNVSNSTSRSRHLTPLREISNDARLFVSSAEPSVIGANHQFPHMLSRGSARNPTNSASVQIFGNPFVRSTTDVINKPSRVATLDDEYDDIGDPDYKCQKCLALFWYDERLKRSTYFGDLPEYSKCCCHGKIVIPKMKEPPQAYKRLLYGRDPLSKEFLSNIRRYNNMFSFTSMGGKIDTSLNDGRGPPNYRIHGENYHLIGSLLPTRTPTPCFAQLYIYDTENEVQNRLQAVRCGDDDEQLDVNVVATLKGILDGCNRLVNLFRHTAERMKTACFENVRLRLINRRSSDGRVQSTPQADEVAVLIVGDVQDLPGYRDIIVESRSMGLQRIDELHVLYLPLQYPLIFLEGEDGFREYILHVLTSYTVETSDKFVTLREYAAYRLHERLLESPHLFFSLRLTQQLFVDLYTMVEQYRLRYIRSHQSDFRCDSYKVLDDALIRGDVDSSMIGKRIIVPPTFTGGARYMVQNYHDAMSICRWVGYPNFFITYTCNPKWVEMRRFVHQRNLSVQDRQDIISRIFHIKLTRFMDYLKKRKKFGTITAAIYTIEWQNRGLPHAHILIWNSNNNDDMCSPDYVDNHISAEIPDKDSDPLYYEAVAEFMMHGPCGSARRDSPCMTENGCSRHFPKRYVEKTTVDNDGYVVYRRRNDGRTIEKNGVELDNRFVVPHNRDLLLKFKAHINVEYCNRSRSIKYLFKYVHKGNDRVTATFYTDANGQRIVDEIKQYLDCRYISVAEAVWRLLSFEIHYRDPNVVRLGFHLENEQVVCWREGTTVSRILKRQKIKDTMFTAWMSLNKDDAFARTLTYAELPKHYVWQAKEKIWTRRQKGVAFGRLYYVFPGSGELFYLRILLNVVRGCTSFQDIREYDGQTFSTYREACYARGLLDDDREYVDAIKEASFWGSEHMLRMLFVNLLVSESMSSPEKVWEKCWTLLAADLQRQHRRVTGNEDLLLSEFEVKNLCLHEIEKLLQKRNRSLKNWNCMPFPENIGALIRMLDNQLIADELSYDRDKLKEEHHNLEKNLNSDQRVVYNTVMNAVNAKKGGVYFLYGYGGTGKTYVWKNLSAAVRSEGGIVLNVASSGIASLLLPGGRTAHSRFAIPLSVMDNSVCNIKPNTALAEILSKADLIVWDEAPMMNRHCFEALDRSLRDIMKHYGPANEFMPFGGKVVVFGGDFRQILPVIPKGTRQDVVRATINSSPLWRDCTVLRLTKNMRLQDEQSSEESNELKQFSEWLSAIGDGKLGGDNDGEVEIEIPNDLLITESDNYIKSIVEATYLNFESHMNDADFLRGRAILAPTLDDVAKINTYMVGLHTSQEKVYLSSDSICRSERGIDTFQDMHTVEFLNTLTCSGLPNHELILKVGVPVMLLRNIDHTAGLCNGTRLLITRLGDHVLEATILSGVNAGDKVFIPRMTLTPADSRIPFKFQRRQFPLVVSYAMTINKSQGQSLDNVGIYLARKVFSHGQLYVAVSRTTNRQGLIMLILDDDGNLTNKTSNVVYKEVFNNV